MYRIIYQNKTYSDYLSIDNLCDDNDIQYRDTQDSIKAFLNLRGCTLCYGESTLLIYQIERYTEAKQYIKSDLLAHTQNVRLGNVLKYALTIIRRDSIIEILDV